MMSVQFTFMLLCCLLGNSLNYEVDKIYRYDYVTSILLNEDASKFQKDSHRDIGYRIISEVAVTPIWKNNDNPKEKLLKIEITNPQLYVLSKEGRFDKHSSLLDKVSQVPIYILWTDGIIKQIYATSSDNLNILKGIASILQLRTEDIKTTEVDVSGECQVNYRKIAGNKIQKNKLNCKYPEQAREYSHPNKIRSPTIIVLSETLYELLNEQKIVNNAIGKEYVRLDATLWKGAAITVVSTHEMKLKSDENLSSGIKVNDVEEILQELSEKSGINLLPESIVAKAQKYVCKENCKTLSNLVKEFRPQLKAKKLSTLISASAFLKLLEKFQTATKQELLQVLKNAKNKDIIPQLLDLISAVQTEAAWDTAVQFLDFTGKRIDLTERFLLGLSVTSHPTEKIISGLLKLAMNKGHNEKLKTTILMTLGSLIKSFRKLSDSSEPAAVRETIDYFINNLKSCKNKECKLMYLRGMKSAAVPSTIAVLLDYAKQGIPYATIALSAIKDMGSQHINEMVVTVLQEIYYQIGQNQDSSVRILAAELLLSSQFNIHIITDLILSLETEPPEISTYVIQKLTELADVSKEIRRVMQRILNNKEIGNYNTFAYNGDSAVFTKPLPVESVNITYRMELEMISGGVLKRSSLGVDIQNKDDKLHFFSIGLFATGLGSLAGLETSDADAEETTAGMELTVLGAGVRPYTFFRGTGELMSHVWSGTGSEPISALQANLLSMDHQQLIVLQNGLVVDASMTGVFSVDLSASIQISIWNRNSHSMVKNSGALLMEGMLKLDSPFAKSQIGFNLSAESYIDFTTDFDFYDSPYKTCLQMNQPDLTIFYHLKKGESIPESEYKVQITSKRKYFLPGKSYAFHKKNTKACSVLLSDAY